MDRMTEPMRPVGRELGDVGAPSRAAASEAVCVERRGRVPSSVALNNLRGVVILIVLGFHSVLAYLGSLEPAAFPFDAPPYEWRAFPIVDNHRWFGFDLFCAWQDVYLMALMFFLSALFTWPSLTRKGWRRFMEERILRLGAPFVFAVIVVMPLALYPVYRVTAIDPGPIAYAQHYLALPFWPNGPMWFLWELLGFTAVAAGLHRCAPDWVESLGRWSSRAAAHPGRVLVCLVVVSAISYVPLALISTPWAWNERGPLAFQFSRPLLYAVYYLAGLGVGANGLGRGLLVPEGTLARRWPIWLATAFASFLLWMGLTALTMNYSISAPRGLRISVAISFALACASSSFFMVAAFLRSDALHSRVLDSFARNSFGMYVFHYIFVTWLQYALLGIALLAVAKASIVFGGTLLLAWATTTILRCVPSGKWLLGAGRRLHATRSNEF